MYYIYLIVIYDILKNRVDKFQIVEDNIDFRKYRFHYKLYFNFMTNNMYYICIFDKYICFTQK